VYFSRMNKVDYIVRSSKYPDRQVKAVVSLLDEGATIPFIARYRKERTGGLDELEITEIRDISDQYNDIIARQQTIIKQIDEQGLLTDELKSRIDKTFDPIKLEDIYLPFKRKRQTKAEKARKAGLEPLAKMIMSQRGGDPEVMAERFLKGEILEIEDAIEGAQHIMAEWINESIPLRERLREQFDRHAVLKTKLVKGKEQEGEHYKNYFDHNERLSSCPSHRFLAIHRAMNEGLISVKARPDEEKVVEYDQSFFS
jgi:uncharacterized protein